MKRKVLFTVSTLCLLTCVVWLQPPSSVVASRPDQQSVIAKIDFFGYGHFDVVKLRVRISTDLSVFAVVLVISISIRGLVSMNLITRGALLLFIVINFQCLLFSVSNATVRGLQQQPGNETSQLIEVVRVS